MESERGDGREEGSPSSFLTYLQAEAFWAWELLLAGETVPRTAAEHTGEQAEQQNVTKQDSHGAAAGSWRLKHMEDTCQLVEPGERVGQLWGPMTQGGKHHSSVRRFLSCGVHLGRKDYPECRLPCSCHPGLLSFSGSVNSGSRESACDPCHLANICPSRNSCGVGNSFPRGQGHRIPADQCVPLGPPLQISVSVVLKGKAWLVPVWKMRCDL